MVLRIEYISIVFGYLKSLTGSKIVTWLIHQDMGPIQ